MDFSEKINIEEWKASHPAFDYHGAVLFLTAQQEIDRRNVFLNLSWLARQYVPNTIMKFYSLTEDQDTNLKKLATLEKGKIFLSNPKSLNDPFDCGCAFYDFENRPRSGMLTQMIEQNMTLLPSNICICSFTGCGIQSMPMWAHYSNNHKGFCIEYDKNVEQNNLLRSLVYPVQYSDSRFDISDVMDEQIDLSVQRVLQAADVVRAGHEAEPLAQIAFMLYNIKHSSWSFEQEYRLSVPSNTPGLPELVANPSKIYIGLNCLKIHSDRLKEIGKAPSIPVYKMKYSERSKSFTLIADQIE